MIRKHPWLALAVGLLVVAFAVLVFSWPLLFLPDRLIADQVRRTASQAQGLEQVRSKLAECYEVLAAGRGMGPAGEYGASGHGESHIHLVVGEYAIASTVEAFVILDARGRVVDVKIRRTTDWL